MAVLNYDRATSVIKSEENKPLIILTINVVPQKVI